MKLGLQMASEGLPAQWRLIRFAWWQSQAKCVGGLIAGELLDEVQELFKQLGEAWVG